MTAPPVPFVECAAIVSGRVAWVLAPTLRARWPQALVDQLAPAMRDECLAVRDALLLAALAYGRASAGGSAVVPDVEVGAHSEEANWITSAEAGRMVGVSERRVRQLLADGRLAGRLAGGRWQVDRSAVSHMAAGRAA